MPIPLGVLAVAGAGGGGGAAGAYEHIETQIVVSNQSSITFANLGSLSSDYKHLQVRGVIRTTENTTVGNLQMRLNGDSSQSYWSHFLNGNGSGVSSFGFATDGFFIGQTCGATAPAGATNAFIVDLLDAFSTNKRKVTRSFYGVSGMTNQQVGIISSGWLTNSVTSIQVLSAGFQLAPLTRVSLYGLRSA